MIHVFIVNPIVCENGMAQKLRDYLSKIPKLNYYVLSTKEPGNEKELVELICHFFDNEALRFYCCGGSGTMRNMINGFPDMSKAEVAFIPFGSSDFLKCFTDDQELFRNIENTINGDVVYVDYINTNVGRALNAVSLGIDSESISTGEYLREGTFLSKRLPYTLAIIYASLIAPNKYFDVSIGNREYYGERMTEVFFGNGAVIGGELWVGIDKNCQDGKATYCIIKNKVSFGRLSIISAARARDYEKLNSMADTGHAEKIKVRRENGTIFSVNLDGEIISTHELHAEIVHQGLRFVLPKGVKIDEQ